MIRYLSTFSVKTLHGMVNRGILRMLALTADEPIYAAAAKSTVEMLKESVEGTGANVRIKGLRVNSKKGRVALLSRYLESAWHNVIELCKSRKGDTLIYNFNNVFSLSLINTLSRTLYKGRKIFIVCHGELEYLDADYNDPRAYKKLMRRLTRRFFMGMDNSRLSKELRFIVLGEGIRKEMGKYVHPDLLARVSAIDHPVMASAARGTESKKEDGKLRIGTVGIMNRDKGALTYIKLLEESDREAGLEYSIAGHVQSDLEKFQEMGVKMGKNPGEALPDEEFAEMVSSLDYILLFYPSDSYKLIASGALLDTLRFGKPLIAISNPYFEYFFKKFGSVGYLEKDMAGMKKRIESIKKGDRAEYDYEGILRRLSPERLAPEFRRIIYG